jgi:hypothetical protein
MDEKSCSSRMDEKNVSARMDEKSWAPPKMDEKMFNLGWMRRRGR